VSLYAHYRRQASTVLVRVVRAFGPIEKCDQKTLYFIASLLEKPEGHQACLHTMHTSKEDCKLCKPKGLPIKGKECSRCYDPVP